MAIICVSLFALEWCTIRRPFLMFLISRCFGASKITICQYGQVQSIYLILFGYNREVWPIEKVAVITLTPRNAWLIMLKLGCGLRRMAFGFNQRLFATAQQPETVLLKLIWFLLQSFGIANVSKFHGWTWSIAGSTVQLAVIRKTHNNLTNKITKKLGRIFGGSQPLQYSQNKMPCFGLIRYRLFSGHNCVHNKYGTT